MVSLALSLSLLFLILAPFVVSFSTSTMKFPLAAGRKNSEKPVRTHSCIYCKKMFANHRALGGHLKTHNVEFKSAWRRNPPGSSSNSIGSTSNTPNPINSNQPGNSCGGVGNSLIPKSSCSIKAIPVHASFAPLVHGICQLNTDVGRTYQDGKPFFYEGALQNSPHNLCKCSFNLSTITNPYPFLGSNQSPCLKETAFASSSFVDLCPGSGRDEGCLCKIERPLTCEEGKRMCPVDVLGTADVMKASKRAKTVSNLPVKFEKSQNKELLLVKDLENPFSGLAISFDAEQEVPADIDLSLHL